MITCKTYKSLKNAHAAAQKILLGCDHNITITIHHADLYRNNGQPTTEKEMAETAGKFCLCIYAEEGMTLSLFLGTGHVITNSRQYFYLLAVTHFTTHNPSCVDIYSN